MTLEVFEIWRSDEKLLVKTGAASFVLIDPTGAIVERYDDFFYVENGSLYDDMSGLAVDDVDHSLELSGLVPDADPETQRFVATVLGDAAVAAEAAKQRGS